MGKIVTLSRFLAKLLFREKATYLLAVMATVIMLISLGFSGTEIGMRYKLFEDILLTSQGYFFVLAALFYAYLLMVRNRNLGLFVLPLSNGMKRYQYLAGQMLALVSLLVTLFIIFGVLDIIAVLWVEGSLYPLVIWQLFCYALSGILVALVVMALSQYVSLTNAMLYAVALFLIGHALDELYLYAQYGDVAPFFREVVPVFYHLLPNFSLFDLQEAVVNRRGIAWWAGGLLPILYFIVWSGILFLTALVRFQKKGLSVED